MKRNRYFITWSTGDSTTISADSLFNAAVLGIADRINDGKATAIASIIDEYNEESFVRLVLEMR